MRYRSALSVLIVGIGMLLNACTSGPPAPRPALDVLSYGIFKIKRTKKIPDKAREISDIEHVRTSLEIPAVMGSNFGAYYRAHGMARGTMMHFRRVLIYPAPGLVDPKTGERHTRYVEDIEVFSGQLFYVGFGFDHEWERVPGRWVMQMWADDRKLSEHVFTVSVP